MYKLLFELSGLSNTEIIRKLNISHNERIQFEKTKKINFERLTLFAEKLEVDKEKLEVLIKGVLN